MGGGSGEGEGGVAEELGVGAAVEGGGEGKWKRRKGELGEFWSGLVIMNVNRRLSECRYFIE